MKPQESQNSAYVFCSLKNSRLRSHQIILAQPSAKCECLSSDLAGKETTRDGFGCNSQSRKKGLWTRGLFKRSISTLLFQISWKDKVLTRRLRRFSRACRNSSLKTPLFAMTPSLCSLKQVILETHLILSQFSGCCYQAVRMQQAHASRENYQQSSAPKANLVYSEGLRPQYLAL